MIELVRATDYLAFTEDQAYEFIAQKRQEEEVLTSSVKYKKETKKTSECWIVTIKTKINDLKEQINKGEDE